MNKNKPYYSQDGRDNNIQHPEWGESETPRIRYAPNITSFKDGISQPRTEKDGLPSARRILLELFQRVEPKPNRNMSQLLLYFGQFIAHDITRSAMSTDLENESMPIPCSMSNNLQSSQTECILPPHPIPLGAVGNCNAASTLSKFSLCPALIDKTDQDSFDVDKKSFDSFARVERAKSNHTSTSINFATSFLDLSHVYGPYINGPGQVELRAFKGGKMLLDSSNELPRKNPKTGHFIMADLSSRATPPMTALVILFLRYHNIRSDFHARLSNFTLSDEELYWLARKDTTCAYQNLVEEKYIPTLIGELLEDYKGYNSEIDPRIDVYFSGSSFRYGHSGISGLIRLLDKDFHQISGDPWLLRDVYVRTEAFLTSGADAASVLRGLAAEASKGIDLHFVDDVAYFTRQMAVVNIQRGRDEGLPSYNDAREWFGFDRVTSFREISLGDEIIEKALANLYASVDDIDSYVGQLLDPKNRVMYASLKEQFTRLRDGDRFWYKNVLNKTEIENLPTLTEMIRTVFGDAEMFRFPGDSFAVMDDSASGRDSDQLINSNRLSLIDGILDVSWNFSSSSEPQSIDMTLQIQETVKGGFIGIGWGAQLMRDAVMWFCNATATIEPQSSCSEELKDSQNNSNKPEFSCCVASTKSRAVPECFDQKYALEIRDSCISDIESFVTIRAPVCQESGLENCFDIPEGEIQFIAAYNLDSLGAHGFSRRTLGTVNLFSGMGLASSNDASNGGIFALHGAMMLLCWFFILPIAIWIVRYKKESKWRLAAHIGLVSIGGSVVISLAPAAIVTVDGALFGTIDGGSTFTNHKIYGLCVIGLVFFMVVTGEIRLTREMNFIMKSPKIDRMVFRLHRVGAICLILIAWYNCYLGLIRMEAYEGDLLEITWFSSFTTSSGVGFFSFFRKFVFYPLVVIIVLIFILSEYLLYRAKLSPKAAKDDDIGRARIFDETFGSSKAEMTIETFLDLTRQGSPLCIVDGYVIDIGDFISYHPGGSRVMRGAIGADITQQILGQRGVDGIVHMHSPMAFRKLHQLAKARLSNASSIGSDPENLSSSITNQPSNLLVFREGKIVDYTHVTPDNDPKSKPILRLQVSVKIEELDEVSSFSFTPLPSTTFVFRGKDTFGTIVERPYTPVRYFIRRNSVDEQIRMLDLAQSLNESDAEKTEVIYEFFISMVSNGLMSRHIDSLSKGDYIMVQGPMANVSLLKKIKLYDDKKNDFICIASGTGIGPILQVIDHYCDDNENSDIKESTHSRQRIFLVWFLRLSREMSSSFKGAIKLESRRKKYGDNFRYIIIYARNDVTNVSHNDSSDCQEDTTGEETFRHAELMSDRFNKNRRFIFRKKHPVTFDFENMHCSINYLPGEEKKRFQEVQSLYAEGKHVDKEMLLKLFAGIIHQWDEVEVHTIESKRRLDTILESGDEEVDMERKIRSIALDTKVAICGSPIFDDICVQFCKDNNFEDKQLFLFGPGDSSLQDIERTILNRRKEESDRETLRNNFRVDYAKSTG